MKQRLTYQDDKSNKFWEVEVKQKEMTVRYGKVGTDGQLIVKKFASAQGAEAAAEKALAEKIKKGYADPKVKKAKPTLPRDKKEPNVQKYLDQLKKSKISSIEIYLSEIRERETVNGTYILENGEEEDGVAYNNNDLSGKIKFSFSDDDAPLSDFVAALNDNDWVPYVRQFIDNFEGPGRSVDYELDEFDEFQEGDSDGCDYEACDDPAMITIHLSDSSIVLSLADDGVYKCGKELIKKSDLLKAFKVNLK
jgi:predicted DNA-binding WGR domain protein